MRLHAYILAADPAWIEASVLSYYDIVDRIVVSYDENSRGWTGAPIDVEQCLTRLRAIDKSGKFDYCPGHFARTEFFDRPMENDTYQRQVALNEASNGADWVLQFDTDEVLADKEIFFDCVKSADRDNYGAIEFPARWIYRQLGNNLYLENCRSLWTIMAGYPGPVAVRAHSRLRVARQCDVRAYRIDFRSRNTDPWRPRDAPVHGKIRQRQGIYHFSLVRNEESLRRKSKSFSHAKDLDWEREIDHWLWCGRHPFLAAMSGLFVRRRNVGLYRRALRVVRIRLPEALAGFNAKDGGLHPDIAPHAPASFLSIAHPIRST